MQLCWADFEGKYQNIVMDSRNALTLTVPLDSRKRIMAR